MQTLGLHMPTIIAHHYAQKGGRTPAKTFQMIDERSGYQDFVVDGVRVRCVIDSLDIYRPLLAETVETFMRGIEAHDMTAYAALGQHIGIELKRWSPSIDNTILGLGEQTVIWAESSAHNQYMCKTKARHFEKALDAAAELIGGHIKRDNHQRHLISDILTAAGIEWPAYVEAFEGKKSNKYSIEGTRLTLSFECKAANAATLSKLALRVTPSIVIKGRQISSTDQIIPDALLSELKGRKATDFIALPGLEQWVITKAYRPNPDKPETTILLLAHRDEV